jgi:DNA-binding NarL/FixJ family response regulator
MLKVVLVESRVLVRRALRRLLEDSSGVAVVGEAADGAEALQRVRDEEPDVVVLSVAVPSLDALEATTLIRLDQPRVGVVMLAESARRHDVHQVLRRGALGYVLKDDDLDELLTAIRAAAEGRRFLSPAVARLVVDDTPAGPEAAALDRLTPRERGVLTLIAESKTSPEIAGSLGVSIHTIETHRRNMMLKLGVHDLVSLVKIALRHGLASLE